MSGCANAGQVLGRCLKLYTPRSTCSLPFLYQTQTLRRYYSALQDLANENVAKTGLQERITRPKREPTSAPTPRTKQEPEEFVPFETSGSPEQSADFQPIQGETLTDTERNAFAQLEVLAGAPKRPAVKKQKQKPAEDVFLSLDDVLNEAISNVESIALAKRAAEEKALAAASKRRPNKKSEYSILDPTPKPSQPDATLPKTKEQRQKESVKTLPLKQDADRTIAAMESAPTDLALWQILETELFTPIATLQLDGPPAISSSSTTTTATPPATPQRRRHLMRTFPKRLILAASLLRTAYPSSNLILSILPRLRQLGPSAYALGTTPNLFNQLLAFRFQKYSDLDSCNTLLSEMESSIIEPNTTTLQILNYILNCRDQAKEGKMGMAVKQVFGTEKFRRGFRELEGWRGRVERSLAEFEIRESRKARNEEARVAEEQRTVKYVPVD